MKQSLEHHIRMDSRPWNRIMNPSLLQDSETSTVKILSWTHAWLCCRVKWGDAEIQMIKNAFGHSKRTKGTPATVAPNVSETASVSNHISKDDAMQRAIRVGRRVMTKQHPDYIPFQMASAVLGGYFGSRLMSNIREDKGYTYGIGSAIVPNIQCGYFFIATEVGKDVCQPAMEEIFKEL
ncbi:MAG: M16 family metallopeptidase, partial [Bacteroidota bacterium]